MVTVSVSSISISPTSLSGTAGESGITLVCRVTLSAPGRTSSLTWTGPRQRGPVTFQQDQTSYMDSFPLGRLRQSYAGEYTCQVSVGSSSMSSNSVRVTVSSKFTVSRVL